jgi:hypothetical protein
LAEVIRLREARENVRSKYGALASSAPGPDASVEGPIRVRPEHVSLFKELFGNLYEIQGDATVRLASKTEETAELARACWGKVLNDALSGDLGRTPDSAETESVRPSIPDALPDKIRDSRPSEKPKPHVPTGESRFQRHERMARELRDEYEGMRTEAFSEMRKKGVSSERIRKIDSLIESIVGPFRKLTEDGDVKYPDESDTLFAGRAIDAIREILIQSALEENAKQGDPPIRPRNDSVEDVAFCLLSGEIFTIATETRVVGWKTMEQLANRFTGDPKWKGYDFFVAKCKEMALLTLSDLGTLGGISKQESERLQEIYEIVFGALAWIEENVRTPLGAKTRGEGRDEEPPGEDRNANVGRKAFALVKKVVTDRRFYWTIFLIIMVLKMLLSIAVPLVYDPRHGNNNVAVRYDTFVSHVEASYRGTIFDDHGYINTDLLDGVTDSDKEKVRLNAMDDSIRELDAAEKAVEREKINPFAERTEKMVEQRKERYESIGRSIQQGMDASHDKSYYSDFVQFLNQVSGTEIARVDTANKAVDPNFDTVRNLVHIAYRNYVDLLPEGQDVDAPTKEQFIQDACTNALETQLVYDDGTPMIEENAMPIAANSLATLISGVVQAAAEKAAVPVEFAQFRFGAAVDVWNRIEELREIEAEMNATINDPTTFEPVENAYNKSEAKIRGLVDDLMAKDAEGKFVELAENGTVYGKDAPGLTQDDLYDAALSTRPNFERLPNLNYRATFSAIMYDARERAQCSAESRLIWCMAEKTVGFFRTLGDYSLLAAEAGYGATAMGRELSYTAYAASTAMAVSSIWGMVAMTFAIGGLGLVVARPRRGTPLGDVRDWFNDISAGSLAWSSVGLTLIAFVILAQFSMKSNWSPEETTGWRESWNRAQDVAFGYSLPSLIEFIKNNKDYVYQIAAWVLSTLYVATGTISTRLGKWKIFYPVTILVAILRTVIRVAVNAAFYVLYKGTEEQGSTAEKEARRMANRRFREWAAHAVFAAFIGWLVVSSGGNSRLQIMEATGQKLDKAREFAGVSGGFRQPPTPAALEYGAKKWNEVRSAALGSERKELKQLLKVVDKIKDIGVRDRLEKVIMRADGKTRLGKSMRKVIDSVKAELHWMQHEREPYETKKRSEFSKMNAATVKQFGIEAGTKVDMAISPGAKASTAMVRVSAPKGKSKPPKGKPPKEPGP